MTTHKRTRANRANALLSTGAKTGEGIAVSKNNALRHGLRALDTVVPGESVEQWEGHRDAVVADLNPVGAVEHALAEQVASKLWRIGRVLRHEANLIGNALSEDEVLRAQDQAAMRNCARTLRRVDVPAAFDVDRAKEAAAQARQTASEKDQAIEQLEALAHMGDEDPFPGWQPLHSALERILELGEKRLQGAKQGEGQFLARIARKMLATRGGVGKMTEAVLVRLRAERLKDESEVREAKRKVRAIKRRYEAALTRQRRANGLPGDADLNRIQRYEAHLERGLHSALERLRALQEDRGAIALRGPTVAVAVLQAGPEMGHSAQDQLGSFGTLP
ncbi:MAG TPA: hypothetical protein VGY53_12465 [Isosphaeraceae bacterium]|nr:hypothetical protein [Isosphaeraceae bacterium]